MSDHIETMREMRESWAELGSKAYDKYVSACDAAISALAAQGGDPVGEVRTDHRGRYVWWKDGLPALGTHLYAGKPPVPAERGEEYPTEADALALELVNVTEERDFLRRQITEGARVTDSETLVRDLAENGLRFSLNPCHDMSSLDAAEQFWHDYMRRADVQIRERAKAALTPRAEDSP